MAKKEKFDWMNARKALGLFRRLWPFLRPQWKQCLLVLVGIGLDSIGGAARLLVIKPFADFAMVQRKASESADGAQSALEVARAGSEFARQVAAGAHPAGIAFAPASEAVNKALTGMQQVMDSFLPYALLLVAAALSMALGTLMKQYFMGYVQSRTVINLQRAVLGRVLSQPMSYFNAQRKGALMSRLTANTGGAGQLVRLVLDGVISSPFSMIALLAVMAFSSPVLTLATFVVLPLVLLPVVMFAARIRKATKKKYQRLEASGNFFHQVLDGIRVVKSYRLEGAQKEEFERVSDEVFLKDRKVARYKGLSRFGIELTYNGILAVALVGAGLLITTAWFQQAGGLGMFAAFFAGLVLLYDPARKMGHALNDVQECTSSLDAVFEVYDRKPEISDQTGAREAVTEFSEIVFQNVGFSYVPERPVLRDIDFKVKRGQMVAFVGQSGMGKSTLMDLIPRFYDPVSGAILVDGVDLREFKLESWLRNIAIVSQETFLFNTSIRQNILCGKPEASEADIIQAAKAAHIWAEIEAMPQGLDTPLGDRGVNLSGGQRQRVAIARAFLRKAPILLLDEATSSLDTNSEREVQKALDELIEGCTVFAVAHRLSTIRKADQILVLAHGRVVERGTHDELVALSGAYATAVRLQQGGENEESEAA